MCQLEISFKPSIYLDLEKFLARYIIQSKWSVTVSTTFSSSKNNCSSQLINLIQAYFLSVPLLFSMQVPGGGDLILSHCIPADSHLNFWEYTLLTYSIFLLILLSYLGYRNSRVKGRQFKEEGQSCARSAAAAVIFTVLFVLSYYLSMHPATQLPFPRHLVLFWYVTIYTTLSPLVIFGALFVPKVS